MLYRIVAKLKRLNEYPGYAVTTDGRVYSFISHKFLSTHKTYNGYVRVELRKDGQRLRKRVHRLVAETFIPNPNNLPQVNHKDENKENNSIENLEWCTQAYNNTYGTRIERIKAIKKNNKSSMR